MITHDIIQSDAIPPVKAPWNQRCIILELVNIMLTNVYTVEVICGSNIPIKNSPKIGPLVTPAKAIVSGAKPPNFSTI